MSFKTPQETFWAGEFGDDYSARVDGVDILAAYTAMHANVLRRTKNVQSVLEFGANIGLNLQAYGRLLPKAELSAIELNPRAVDALKKITTLKMFTMNRFLDFVPDYQRDLVLIKTVLIHINPDALQEVYERLYKSSKQYICVAEYYNPTQVVVEYRGHTERLFKRDFAGELMDQFPDLKLVDYGFMYHRDNAFPLGDVNWFLMEK